MCLPLSKPLLVLWILSFCWCLQNELHAQAGKLDPAFNPLVVSPDLQIHALIPQPDGRVLLGGYYTKVNGADRFNLTRLNSDGSLDTTFLGAANNAVECMVVQPDGKILIGGAFTLVNSSTRNYLARLNSDGSVDTNFYAGAGFDAQVLCMAIQSDGKIIAGGIFQNFDGTPASRIVRLNSDGTLDTSFQASANGNVYSVVTQPDGNILACGPFTSINSTTCNHIARFDVTGVVDQTFAANAAADGDVYSVVLQTDGRIILGGKFANVDGAPAARISRLNTNGTLDTGFFAGQAAADGTAAISLALQTDGKILFGGSMATLNGKTVHGLGRLNTDGSLDLGFNPGTAGNRSTFALALQADGSILAGGAFTTVNGVSRAGCARYFNDTAAQTLSIPDTTQITWFRTGAEQEVTQVTFDLSTDGGQTWMPEGTASRIDGGWQATGLTLPPSGLIRAMGREEGGANGGSSGIIRQYAAFPVGNADPSFVVGTGANSEVLTAAVQPDGKILITGGFTSWNGAALNAVVRLNGNGRTDTTFQSSASTGTSYQSLAVQEDGNILVGTQSSPDTGTALKYLSRLTTTGATDSTFNAGTGPNNTVKAIIFQPDGKVLIGGTFTSVNGTALNGTARLSSGGALDTTYNPKAGISNQAGAGLFSMALQDDGRILIGGVFAPLNGEEECVARMNADGSVDNMFVTTTNNVVSCMLVQPDGKIVIGGNFSNADGYSRFRIARVYADGTLDTAFDPAGADDTILGMALQADGKILIGGTFLNVNGVSCPRIARLNPDGSLDTFDPGTGPTSEVDSVALMADGGVLITGNFSQVNQFQQPGLARLSNDPAVHILDVHDGSAIQWLRSGSSPEIQRATFEVTQDGGATWQALGAGTRIDGGWQLTAPNLPSRGAIRARGRTICGALDGSSGLVEDIQSFSFPTLSPVSITSSNTNSHYATSGDSITLTFTAGGAIQVPVVTIAGETVSAVNTSGNIWTATLVIPPNDSLPQGPVAFSITCTDNLGHIAAPVIQTTNSTQVTLDTENPSISAVNVPTQGYELGMTMPDLRGLLVISDMSTPLVVTQDPAPGTTVPAGPLLATFGAKDPAGNIAQAQTTLDIGPNTPSIEVLLAKGDIVTGETGINYAGFGLAETSAFAGTAITGKQKSAAIFGPDGSLLLQAGAAAPGYSATVISSLAPPSGDVALATLKPGFGGVTARNNVFFFAGLSTNSPTLAARTGIQETAMPLGVTVKSFVAIDGNGTDPFFLVTLQGTGVTAANNLALCVTDGGNVRILVRKGDLVGTEKISVISTLTGSAGTTAAGRWRIDGTTIGVRLTYSDKSEAIYAIPASAAGPADWILKAATGPTSIPGIAGTTITSFGLPGFGSDSFAVRANLKGVPTSSNAAILTNRDGALAVLLRKGGLITSDANQSTLTNVTIRDFSDPIAGANGAVSLFVTAAGSHFPSNRMIGYSANSAAGFEILANRGAFAPGGGKWANLPSLVLPRNYFRGPVFLGTLTVNKAENINAGNNVGIWAVDAKGQLESVLRTGTGVMVDGSQKVIHTIATLVPAARAIGSASGYDDDGNVAVLATFTDGTQALLNVAVP